MSAEFIAEDGLLKGLILSLGKGEEWVVGRDPDQCAIILEDPEVSRVHLNIRKTPEGYLVENVSDTHPALVNGMTLTQPTLLEDHDLLTIGGTDFHFYLEGPPHAESVSFEVAGMGMDEEEEPEEVASKEEEDLEHEEIFQEEEFPEFAVDLTASTRFLIKVIAGPNTGAEFALESDHTYLIGTDTTSCEIVFNDLSVSREHARLELTPDRLVFIEDLGSRNGVIVDHERIEGKRQLFANSLVAIGTSVFLLVDREAPSETIASSLFEAPQEEVTEEPVVVATEGGTAAAPPPPPPRPLLPVGTLLLSVMIAGFIVLFGIAAVSLFQSKPIEIAQKDYQHEVKQATEQFPAVRFTFNPLTGRLFILGHVQTGVEKSELFYKLQGLPFIKGIEDNVVNDEAIWQETNILLSKYPDFKGVSLHAPEPGVFVLTGYLETDAQAASLMDYMNIHFNYLNLLQNRVIVSQEINEEASALLFQKGLHNVNVSFTNGDLILTGYVNTDQNNNLQEAVDQISTMNGIRSLKNFVITVTPPPKRPPGAEGEVDEQGVFHAGIIDLNKKYPGRYRVTGYSKHNDININVVINGKIYTRGDLVDDEFTLVSIQPHTIFLEKDNLKYKIEYNR